MWMAFRAGTKGSKLFEGVEAGPVAVAPGDLDRIVSDKTHFERMDVLADCGRLNSFVTRYLIDTSGTGAGES